MVKKIWNKEGNFFIYLRSYFIGDNNNNIISFSCEFHVEFQTEIFTKHVTLRRLTLRGVGLRTVLACAQSNYAQHTALHEV